MLKWALRQPFVRPRVVHHRRRVLRLLRVGQRAPEREHRDAAEVPPQLQRGGEIGLGAGHLAERAQVGDLLQHPQLGGALLALVLPGLLAEAGQRAGGEVAAALGPGQGLQRALLGALAEELRRQERVKLLVTGATGFLGSALVPKLAVPVLTVIRLSVVVSVPVMAGPAASPVFRTDSVTVTSVVPGITGSGDACRPAASNAGPGWRAPTSSRSHCAV